VKVAILKRYRHRTVPLPLPFCTVPFRSVTVTLTVTVTVTELKHSAILYGFVLSFFRLIIASGKDNVNLDLVLGRGIFFKFKLI
jgi:hypothetical protein